MPRFLRYALCFASLAAMTLLAASVHERQARRRRAERRFHDWDIPQLAAHLQRSGVDVRLVPVSKDGSPRYSAFLTSTAKDWHQLNGLVKDPRRINDWRGTLCCERIGDRRAIPLVRQWGKHSLEVRPFLFYGDAELLARVRTALDAPPATP